MFQSCVNLTKVEGFTSNIMKSTHHMFCDCESLTSIGDLSNWQVGNVTEMTYMFYNCSNLTELDLSNWNTSNVTDMSIMFCAAGYDNPNFSLNIKDWDVSQVTNMQYMFDCCRTLKELDLSGWDISNAKNMMWMFGNDEENDSMILTKLNLSDWKFNNDVNMENFFSYTDKINEVIMNNSDYNSVNKVIAQLPTRTSDSMGTLDIIGIDDFSQVDIATAESKFWTVVNEELEKNESLKLGGNTIDGLYIGGYRIIQMYLNGQQLL